MASMPRLILVLAYVALTVYALADVANTPESRSKGLPKLGWLLVIVFVPFLGAFLWLLAGKDRGSQPNAARAPRSRAPQRPLAPDDDPAFLAKLDQENRARRREHIQEEMRRKKREEGALGSSAAPNRPRPAPGRTPAPKDDSRITPAKGPRDYTVRDYERPEDKPTGDLEGPDDDGARR